MRTQHVWRSDPGLEVLEIEDRIGNERSRLSCIGELGRFCYLRGRMWSIKYSRVNTPNLRGGISNTSESSTAREDRHVASALE